MTPSRDEPLFTPKQVREDGQNRVKGTGGQNAVALAVVTVGTYVSWKAGWLRSMEDLPVIVHDAFVLLLTVGAAAVSNLGRLRAK